MSVSVEQRRNSARWSHAEESVTTNREVEELTILGSTAPLQMSIGVDDPEGIDVQNESGNRSLRPWMLDESEPAMET